MAVVGGAAETVLARLRGRIAAAYVNFPEPPERHELGDLQAPGERGCAK